MNKQWLLKIGCVCLVMAMPAVALAETVAKIVVDQAGIYRLNYQDLQVSYQDTQGVTQTLGPINIGRLHLTNRGISLPLQIDDANGNDLIEDGDSISFYGQPILPSDPEYKYTLENTYWLKLNDDAVVSMPSRSVTTGGVAVSTGRHTSHFEQNSFYWQSMPDGVGRDHWFWGKPMSVGDNDVRDVYFELAPLSSLAHTVSITVTLHGRSALDHHTFFRLNGSAVYERPWSGAVPVSFTFDVPSSDILSGINTLTIVEAVAGVSSLFVDAVEVTYDRVLTAQADQLDFVVAGGAVRQVTLSGFTNADVQVYDVTDPLSPSVLTDVIAGSNSVTFSDDLTTIPESERRYIAVAAPLSPVAISAQDLTLPRLKSPELAADYIVITHEDFLVPAEQLAQYRRGVQGGSHRVEVVTTQMIYDEFSHGIFTPQAIKDFLKSAYDLWVRPVPQYVVLLGDANLDYKDHYLTGEPNWVPTHLIETSLAGETPSDNWFVTGMTQVNGQPDLLPAMSIGRIPAKTTVDIERVIDKIQRYEGHDTISNGEVLLASGAHAGSDTFERVVDEWQTMVVTALRSTIMKAASFSFLPLANDEFIRTINRPSMVFAAYFGHGTQEDWLDLLSVADVPTMAVKADGILPFFAGFSCLNGFFAFPHEGVPGKLGDSDSIYPVPLSEALVMAENKGGIAMFSPSVFSYPSEEEILGDAMFDQMFTQGVRELGRAATLAKIDAVVNYNIHPEILDVYVFIGDPATRMVSGVVSTANTSGGTGGGGAVNPLLMVLMLILWRVRRSFSGALA